MLIELTSLSPISFMLTKVGDRVEIKVKKPNKNEFRGSIGSATEVFLVFKGPTKIGMIPTNFDSSIFKSKRIIWGKIQSIESTKKQIIIEITS
jgi:hypothetical protein